MINLLKKFNKQFLTVLIVASLFLAGRANFVFAAEEAGNHIKIEAKGEDKGLGIFNDKDGLWYPGREALTKGFIVKSNYEKEVQFNKFFVSVQPLSSSVANKVFGINDELYKQFSKYLRVTLKDESSVYYTGTFEDFSSKGVDLATPIKVLPNNQKEFMLTLSFDEKAGNDFQDLTHKFNMLIQYTLSDESTGIDTSAPPIQVGDNLPKTGRVLDFAVMISLGLIVAAAGFFLLGNNNRSYLKTLGLKEESKNE